MPTLSVDMIPLDQCYRGGRNIDVDSGPISLDVDQTSDSAIEILADSAITATGDLLGIDVDLDTNVTPNGNDIIPLRVKVAGSGKAIQVLQGDVWLQDDVAMLRLGHQAGGVGQRYGTMYMDSINEMVIQQMDGTDVFWWGLTEVLSYKQLRVENDTWFGLGSDPSADFGMKWISASSRADVYAGAFNVMQMTSANVTMMRGLSIPDGINLRFGSAVPDIYMFYDGTNDFLELWTATGPAQICQWTKAGDFQMMDDVPLVFGDAGGTTDSKVVFNSANSWLEFYNANSLHFYLTSNATQFTDTIYFRDDVKTHWGSNGDFYALYDEATDDAWQFWSANGPTQLVSVPLATYLWTFLEDVQIQDDKKFVFGGGGAVTDAFLVWTSTNNALDFYLANSNILRLRNTSQPTLYALDNMAIGWGNDNDIYIKYDGSNNWAEMWSASLAIEMMRFHKADGVVEIRNNGDAILRLHGDADNNNEEDMPQIEFYRNGGTLGGYINSGGAADVDFSGKTANSLAVVVTNNEEFQVATGGEARITVQETGVIEFGRESGGASVVDGKIDLMGHETGFAGSRTGFQILGPKLKSIYFDIRNDNVEDGFVVRVDPALGGAPTTEAFKVYGSSNVGITAGVNDPGARLAVDQNSATGAIPVLLLDQADISEEFIRFIGSAAAATLTQSIVDDGDVTTATLQAWLKVYVQDDGDVITDQAYFIPIYTLA